MVTVKRFFRHNGLSVVLLLLFVLTWFAGQYLAGFGVHNEELRRHGQPELSRWDYLRSAHFAEATFENWESEFFQMGVFVWLTAFLFQKGSAESNDPDDPPDGRVKPRAGGKSPWPVRRGGFWLRLYSHSLSLALLGFFILCFVGHAWSGFRLENLERKLQGEPAQTMGEFLRSSQFWFESFQNWQSEFLSIFVMVVFTIYLREKNSPESKPVDAPHAAHE
jgi:hypothetical protein